MGILSHFRLARAFKKAHKAALQPTNDLDLRLQSSEIALDLVDQIEPWPFSSPTRRQALGALHANRAMIYHTLRYRDPMRYSELAVAECEVADKFFDRTDGVAWANHKVNTALACATRIEGEHASNVAVAIARNEEALSALDPQEHRGLWAKAKGHLAECYADLADRGDPSGFDRPIALMTEALAGLSRARDPVAWASARARLGTYLTDRMGSDAVEDRENAIAYIEEAIRIFEERGEQELRRDGLDRLVVAYARRLRGEPVENFERALALNQERIQATSKVDSPAPWAFAMLRRASLLMQRSAGDQRENRRDALLSVHRALDVLTPDAYPGPHAEALATLAAIQGDQLEGSAKDHGHLALNYAREAAARWDRTNSPRDWVHAQCALANALLRARGPGRSDRVAEAMHLYERALEALSGGGSRSDRATLLGNYSNAIATMEFGDRVENLERAITLLDEALSCIDVLHDPKHWAHCMRNQAINYLQRDKGSPADNIEYALVLCERALVVMDEDTDRAGNSELLETLGDAFVDRIRGDKADNLERALQAFDMASVSRKRHEDTEAWLRLQQKKTPVQSRLRSLQGDTQHSATDEESAPKPADPEEYLARLEDEASAVDPEDHPRTWVIAMVNLGDMCTRVATGTESAGLEHVSFATAVVSRGQRALAAYKAAIARVDRDAEPMEWARVTGRIAGAYEFLHIWTQIRDQGLTGAYELSQLDRLECSDEAREHHEAAVAAALRALEVHTIERSPAKHLSSAMFAGRLHITTRDWTAAAERFTSAGVAANMLLSDSDLSEDEARATLHDLQELASIGPFAALMTGLHGRAAELAETGRARLLARALSLDALPIPPAERHELHELQQQLTIKERELLSPMLVDRGPPLAAAMSLRSQIQKIIARSAEGALTGLEVSARAERVAAAGTIVVIPVLTYHGGQLLVGLQQNGVAGWHSVGVGHSSATSQAYMKHPSASSIGSWEVAYARYGKLPGPMGQRVWHDALAIMGDALGSTIVGPLLRALDELGAPRDAPLHILTSGDLATLPLTIAPASPAESLVERREVSLVPSLTTLVHCRERANRNPWPESLAVIADPSTGAAWSPLPSTRLESDLAASWFRVGKAITLAGEDATIESTLEALERADLWHFASHGTFEPKAPLQSGLVLSHGQVLSIDTLLNARGLRQPRLVILSACDTALYDQKRLPNEFTGLPSAFLHAGAAGVIATLWPVDDLPTALLIGKFYDAFLGDRMPPAAAMRAAQRWIQHSTVEDLKQTIRDWETARRISAEQAGVVVGALAGAFPDDNIRPLASPTYWGGFVHYGV